MLDLAAWDDGFDVLSRHLPWDCLVAPGVVLLEEDAALLAVVEYRGRDQEVLAPDEVQRMAAGVATILQPFTGGWCLHFELQRRWAGGYPTGTGAHAASALIDAERRDRLGGARAGLVSRTFIAVTWTPATAPVRRTAAWFTRGAPEQQVADVYRDHVEPFARLVAQFASLLGRVLGQARLLTGPDLLGMLHSCVSPQPMDRVAVPEVPGFPLKAAILDTGFLPGAFPCWTNGTARWHMRVIGILGYPGHAHPGLLNGLLSLPFPFRWSIRFECMDQMQARGVFAALWRRHDDTSYDWRSVLLRSVGGVQSLRHDAVGVLEAMEAEAARLEAAQAGTSAGWLTPTAVVWGESAAEADDHKDELVKLLRGLGFACIEEGLGAERAWYGTMPGHVRPNPRKVPMTQVVLSDLVVLSSPWPGAGWNRRWNCPPLLRLETPGGEGFNLDIVTGDDAAALVIGPPRTGKSTLLAVLGHQFLARVPGGRVVWLDVDSELSTSRIATLAAGGEHLSMGGGAGDLALQPLAEIDRPAGLAWAAGWLADLLAGERSGAGAEELARALQLLAAAPVGERTLTHLRHLVQSERLRAGLAPWCRGGALGDLLDADTDRLRDSPWITVDLGNLLERGRAAEPTLRALFRRLYRLFEDGRPTLFLVDEAFKALRHHADELDELRRRGPKRNVALVLATHLLDDIAGSAAAAMLATIPTLILLPDPAAPSRGIYRGWGLSRAALDLVAAGLPRRDLLVHSRDGARLGRLELDPAALAICARGGAADRARAEAVLARSGPEGFAAAWLRANGLEEEADRLALIQGGALP